ncbi:hypothetical protein SAMN05421636_102449 [Pricia antarctica]|uniref:Uncharacterized protein n=1 Tax=Pricia antarctica TaxID=641691 RepID=A0A1G6Z198_9FLAO|nr:hypothetical protein [Pricia antarctica]SDD96311.1 hypothetical protein SAMN05421636_102449 [Pricia antarctica]
MSKKNINKKPQETQETSEKYNSEVTKEDIDALGKKGLSMDGGDDRLLEKRKKDIDFSGKDLDIAGRDATNNTNTKNLKDEENTLYGQGTESKEGLEAPERANTDKSK